MLNYTKTINVTRPRLEITHDQFAENPREGDDLGYFITIEKNRFSPDNIEDIISLIQNLGEESTSQQEHIRKIKQEFLSNFGEKIITIYPIYRYEHSNIVYKLGTAHGFDISNCGFYIITDKTLKGYGKIARSKFEEIIEKELVVYTQWVNGEVYCVTLYDKEGEVQEQCGDIYGLDSVRDRLPKEFADENLSDYFIS